MWIYEKRLQCPVNIKETNAKLAQAIISQYGGPDGEMGASMRYLSQRYAMPYKECQATLTDIGTEELGHQTCTRIWLLSRRRAVPTTTSSDYVRIIRMFTSRSNSFVHVK